MNDLQPIRYADDTVSVMPAEEISAENRLEIIEEGLRKKYLARLTEMKIVPLDALEPLESYLIDNVRLYRITEMVYHKGELSGINVWDLMR